MTDYKNKYIKYKNKYINLKGGKIPFYNPNSEELNETHIFPIENNIIFDVNHFIYTRKPLNNSLNFKDIFNFQENKIIINEKNIIPFHTLFLQFNFNIIENFKNLCEMSKLSKKNKDSIINKFKEHFVFSSDGRYIGVSAKPNQLTKYIYINKILEYLRIVYNTDINIKDQLLVLYDLNEQKLIDLYDMFDVYNDYTNRNINLDEYKSIILENKNKNEIDLIIEKEIKYIESFRKFINIIDNMDLSLNNFLKIKPSLLFFSCYLSERLKNNCLTIGRISSKLFCISMYDYVLNLIGNNNTLPEPIENPTVKNLYNFSLLPNVYNYGKSVYNGNSYADCVETGLLHLIRCLIYNIKTQNYDLSLLENIKHKIDNVEFTINQTINIELLNLLQKLTLQNENSDEIKNVFSNIVSDIEDAQKANIYKQGNYEIKSSQTNFDFMIKKLLGIDEIQKIKSENIKIKKSDRSYEIKYANVASSIIITVIIGHTSVGYNTNYKKNLSNYIYKDLIILLTDKYYVHDKIHFNIEKYLIYENHILSLHLKFMLLNKNLYFIGDGIKTTDLVTIIIKNSKVILPFFSKASANFTEQEIIFIILESQLIKYIFYKINVLSDIPESIKIFSIFFNEYKDVIINNNYYDFIDQEYYIKIPSNINNYTIKNLAEDLIIKPEFNEIIDKDLVIKTLF